MLFIILIFLAFLSLSYVKRNQIVKILKHSIWDAFLWKDKDDIMEANNVPLEEGVSMISRKAFIDKANQEGFPSTSKSIIGHYNNFRIISLEKRL